MTKVWTLDSEPTLRRFNPRGGPPYSITHDRYTTATENHSQRRSSRNCAIPSYDQQHEQEEEQDQKNQSRRRIPVACGRCRKRKIRCSGAQGDMGCLNCKNAGVDNCQFNRVSSFETPYVKTSNEYEYDTNIARSVQCRFPPVAHFSSQVPFTNSNLVHPNMYRSPVEYSYPAAAKQVSYLSSYAGEYADENVDYSLSGSTYPLMDHENMNVGNTSYTHEGGRVWNSTPQLIKTSTGSTMYYEDGTGPSYTPQMTYQHHNYGIRPTMPVENNNFSFTNMASSLPIPSPMACNDRILPPISASSRGSIVSYHGLPSQPLIKASPQIAPMLPASSYIPLSSSTETLHSAHHTYPSMTQSQSHQIHQAHSQVQSQHHQQPQVQAPQAEMYPQTSSDTWTANGLPEPALRSHSSNGELYYTHSSSDDRKPSQSAQGSNGSAGRSSDGLLMNGHTYVVPYPEATTTGRSGAELGHGHARRGGVVGGPVHRGSNASLRA